MVVLRALPGAGKTWLCERDTSMFDGDAIILATTGMLGSDANTIIRNSPLMRVELRRVIARYSACGTVLTSLPDSITGKKARCNVGYDPAKYLLHLKIARRDDLLLTIDHKRLVAWAEEMASCTPYVQLAPGAYLASVIHRIFQ